MSLVNFVYFVYLEVVKQQGFETPLRLQETASTRESDRECGFEPSFQLVLRLFSVPKTGVGVHKTFDSAKISCIKPESSSVS